MLRKVIEAYSMYSINICQLNEWMRFFSTKGSTSLCCDGLCHVESNYGTSECTCLCLCVFVIVFRNHIVKYVVTNEVSGVRVPVFKSQCYYLLATWTRNNCLTSSLCLSFLTHGPTGYSNLCVHLTFQLHSSPPPGIFFPIYYFQLSKVNLIDLAVLFLCNLYTKLWYRHLVDLMLCYLSINCWHLSSFLWGGEVEV